MKKQKCQRYKLNKPTLIVFILLLIISFICYVLLTLQLNFAQNIEEKTIAYYKTGRDILLIIISTISVNLLSSVLIEVNSKNNYLSEIMANDVVSSPNFYNNMDFDVKRQMFEALEENMFAKHSVIGEMYRNVRNKLNGISDEYYYTNCAYSVTCTIYDNYIEKEITRTTSIRSYDNSAILQGYKIIEYSSKLISGLNSFEKITVKINNTKINDGDCEETSNDEETNLREQNEYDYFIDYIYKKDLAISSASDTTIVLKYKTRTSIDDRISTFRVAYPCKKFTLYYEIKQHEDYRIAGSAYGFLDNASNSNNNAAKSNITIEFSDWIFKHDGATVVILDK